MAAALQTAYTPQEPAARKFTAASARVRALLGPIADGRGQVCARALFRLGVSAPSGVAGAGRWLVVAPDRDTRDEHTVPQFLQALPGGAGRDERGSWVPLNAGIYDVGARRWGFDGVDQRGREFEVSVQFLNAANAEDRRRLESPAQGVWLDDAHRLDAGLFDLARRGGSRLVLLSGAMPAADHWLATDPAITSFYRVGEEFAPIVAAGGLVETVEQKRARYRGYLDAAFGDEGE